jgi:hypothetical protein
MKPLFEFINVVLINFLDVVEEMDKLAPMLSILGYDPYSNPPNYGKPDSFVKENTNKVCKLISCKDQNLMRNTF